MDSRALDRARLALTMVISAPVKPGTVHRLVMDPVYEVRVAESIVLMRYLDEAFDRGAQLARGSIDARSLRLGQLFSKAVRDMFDFTEERPLAGLAFASLAASVVAGYASVTGRDTMEEFRRLARLAAYASSGEDTLEFISGLEAIGFSDALLELERKGYTRRRISLEDLPIGEILEELSHIDTGFWFNIRRAQSVIDIWKRVRGSTSIVELVVRTFYNLGVEVGALPRVDEEKASLLQSLAGLDRRLERGATDSLLGGTALIAIMHNVAEGLPPVAGLPKR